LFVYGCLADIAPERQSEFADLPHLAPRELDRIDAFLGDPRVPFASIAEPNVVDRSTNGLVELVRRKVQSGSVLGGQSLGELAERGRRAIANVLRPRSEPWSLFVCRGCRGKCTYCAIRRSIGALQSKPIVTVVDEFRAGIRAGFREFSILGDDPGCYGLERGDTLPALVEALADACDEPEPRAAIDGHAVLHVREIHPKFAIAYEKALTAASSFRRVKTVLCPVQSGSARILERMGREHAPGDLLKTMVRARTTNPDVRLETQIIVGFPSETDDDFGDTLRLVRDAGFSSVVVFPYHDKEGADATALEPKVPPEIIRRRMRAAFRYFRRELVAAWYSCP
jgi:tRNA A37 methylthiotransferase MiaB